MISKQKGHGKINNQKVPLIDNNIIEQALGMHNIVCLEDIIHQVTTVGPHFKEVTSFLGAFAVNKPKEGLHGKKYGGDSTGNRQDLINNLISKMN